MNLKEIEIMVSEIELRLDRLRALYEQYFMGYEKLEPQVQRKDVERRFHILRKENFRNTALRFRLNVTIQKYSTYQSYWQRICRQIEEGTYKRHVLRAKARFAERETKAGRRAPGDLDLDIDVELDDDAFLASLHDEGEPDVTFEEDEAIDTIRPEAPPVFEPEPAREAHPRASLGDPAPSTLRGPPLGALRAPPPPSSFGRDTAVTPDTQRQLSPTPQPSRPSLRPIAPPQRTYDEPDGDGPPSRGASPEPPRPLGGPPAPARLGPPAPTRLGGPLPPRAAPPAPPTRPGPPSVARPGPQSVTQANPPRPAAPEGNLSDDRIRQIYAQYVREKRSRGESTAATTFESVARSLRSSSEKLRGQHAGRDVDFEVTEKDGRTILKPVVK